MRTLAGTRDELPAAAAAWSRGWRGPSFSQNTTANSSPEIRATKSCGRTHAKLREVLRRDFFDWSDAGDLFVGFDACFFCLGVSATEMSAQEYFRQPPDALRADRERSAEIEGLLMEKLERWEALEARSA